MCVDVRVWVGVDVSVGWGGGGTDDQKSGLQSKMINI